MTPDPTPAADRFQIWRLMLAGLLAGLVSAVIAATTMLALSNYEFYSKPHFGEVVGSGFENYATDLPSTLYAAVIWYVPAGLIVFPWIARLAGAAGNASVIRLAKLLIVGGLTWFLIAGSIYWLLGQVMHLDPAAEREDLTTAALSGALFGVVYDLALHLWRR